MTPTPTSHQSIFFTHCAFSSLFNPHELEHPFFSIIYLPGYSTTTVIGYAHVAIKITPAAT